MARTLPFPLTISDWHTTKHARAITLCLACGCGLWCGGGGSDGGRGGGNSGSGGEGSEGRGGGLV